MGIERGILKSCEALGIKSQVKPLSVDISMDELIHNIEVANKDLAIHGINNAGNEKSVETLILSM